MKKRTKNLIKFACVAACALCPGVVVAIALTGYPYNLGAAAFLSMVASSVSFAVGAANGYQSGYYEGCVQKCLKKIMGRKKMKTTTVKYTCDICGGPIDASSSSSVRHSPSWAADAAQILNAATC